MKRISRILIPTLACAIALASCSKSDKSELPSTYRIDGIKDLEFTPTLSNKTPEVTVPLNIVNLVSFQENIKLSLQGLPTGFQYKFSYPNGYPTFSTEFTVSDISAEAGTYPIKLICEGSKSGKSSYNLNLVVKQLDPISGLLGKWKVDLGSSGTVGYDTVTKYSEANAIMFNNFGTVARNIYAKINPNNLTITIPAQQASGMTFYGTGQITSSNHMDIDATVISGPDTGTITFHYEKQ